jgi:hypothetical protein
MIIFVFYYKVTTSLPTRCMYIREGVTASYGFSEAVRNTCVIQHHVEGKVMVGNYSSYCSHGPFKGRCFTEETAENGKNICSQ